MPPASRTPCDVAVDFTDARSISRHKSNPFTYDLSMKKAFTKGQKVTVFGNWDGKGTAHYQQAEVVSCGVKQMALKCAVTGTMMGVHYKPVVGTISDIATAPGQTVVVPAVDDATAHSMTLEAAEVFLASYRQRYATSRACNPNNHFYLNSINEEEMSLHEPRVHIRN